MSLKEKETKTVDRLTFWRFLQTFAWSVQALQLETLDLGWTPEELAWPKKILQGEIVKIAGNARMLQDRFARVFQDFFRNLPRNEEGYWETMEEIKQEVFENWRNWNA